MAEIKIALIQMPTVEEVAANLETAREKVKYAAGQGADIVVLPEMFCCLYQSASFLKNKEPQGGRIWQALCRMAADNRVYLVGGSMPEQDGDKIYNTSFIFAPDGVQIGKHRKVHLFDIDVEGGQHFKESDTFTAGSRPTVINTKLGVIGVEICFDVRFEELTRLMALEGAEMVFVPAAFNMTTGPAHWQTHFRGRALDNQLFMFGCAPARDVDGPYVSYGHSIAVSPWGDVIEELDEAPGVLICEIDTDQISSIRQQLPIMKNRRSDLYTLSLNQ